MVALKVVRLARSQWRQRVKISRDHASRRRRWLRAKRLVKGQPCQINGGGEWESNPPGTLANPTLVLKTSGTTRNQSPPRIKMVFYQEQVAGYRGPCEPLRAGTSSSPNRCLLGRQLYCRPEGGSTTFTPTNLSGTRTSRLAFLFLSFFSILDKTPSSANRRTRWRPRRLRRFPPASNPHRALF